MGEPRPGIRTLASIRENLSLLVGTICIVFVNCFLAALKLTKYPVRQKGRRGDVKGEEIYPTREANINSALAYMTH